MRMLKKFFSIVLSLSMIMLPIQVTHSAMIENDQLLADAPSTPRAELLQTLEREQVRSQLTQLGVDADAVKQRVSLMTEQEVVALNERLNEMPAGGDAIGIVLFIFVLFVITDAIGATDIFPFVHPVR